MPLSKEDLKAAANKWNWRPPESYLTRTPKPVHQAKVTRRRSIEERLDNMRIEREFAL